MMEVYAGFLSHTDHHLGRLLDFLAESGELDRTLVVALSDNGASAEGGPHGTFNENFIFNGLPHDVEATRAAARPAGGARRPTGITPGAGRMPATRPSGAGSARRTRAASATR